ncbi:MAG: hypothetical protein WC588_03410 [Candidatus Micrarchaeia archaeon]
MNELNFLDLVILQKVDAESSVEKFGSMINTSFFETANLLGTVKIKGYINIESSLGGISKVTLTEAGSALLLVAEQRAKEPIEPLDNAILHALAGGAKELGTLQTALNIRAGDLAFHINKLVAQSFMDYTVRSAKVEFVLTEAGFNCVGGVRVQQKLEAEVSPSLSYSEKAGQAAGGQKEDAAKGEKEKAPGWLDGWAVEQAHHAKKENIPATPVSAEKKPSGIEKDDVAHLLGNHAAAKPASHAHPRKRQPEKEERELTPEEKKRRRFFSKLEYYFVEYLPYLVLILVVLAIFIGAAFLSITKLL